MCLIEKVIFYQCLTIWTASHRMCFYHRFQKLQVWTEHNRHTHLLTNQELLCVEQFARLLLLQLVGFIHKRSQRSFPVNPSLAEALSVQAIRRHPQEHPLLQYAGEHVSALPLRLRVREGKKDHFCPAVKLVLLARGRGGGRGRWRRGGMGGDATTFWAGGGDLLHQRLSVVQGHVEAAICEERRESSADLKQQAGG